MMGWEQTVTITITMIVSILGAIWYLHGEIATWRKEHREDIQKMDEWHREDLQKMDEKIERMDARWAALFEKFHILDKDLEKFRFKGTQ